MTKAFYLDFDGTLISAAQRLYTLFQELTPESSLTFDEYWDIKRRRTNQADLLGGRFGYTPAQISAFKQAWLAKVEEPARLALDTPLPGAEAMLKYLATNHTIYLVTARQHPEHVTEQLAHFGWSSYFTKVLVTRQTASKTELIHQQTSPQPGDVYVGDTGEDIHTAREVGLTAVAVASGFLNREILQTYNPDYLIESIEHLHETGLL